MNFSPAHESDRQTENTQRLADELVAPRYRTELDDREARGTRFSTLPITSLLAPEERDYLKSLVKGDRRMARPDETTLANLLLHYLKEQYGDAGFGLRTSIRYFVAKCRGIYQGEQRLIELAGRLAPVPKDLGPMPTPYSME